jgi:hypothetical protein
MRPSTELRELLVEYWEAMSTGRTAFVEAHLSTRPEILGIGTDPAEWHQGHRLHRVWRQQLQEVPGLSVRPGGIEAYEEGTVGWVADQPTFVFADGGSFTARFTAVARREDGAWKLVQAHASVGVANEHLLGQLLPT